MTWWLTGIGIRIAQLRMLHLCQDLELVRQCTAKEITLRSGRRRRETREENSTGRAGEAAGMK